MDTSFSYSFPAIRGLQAGKPYYVAMCPLRIIPKIFLFDEEEVPPEFRSQRIINKARIPELTSYIIENLNDYVFSSITASVDGEIQFLPFSSNSTSKDLGQLKISLDARFLINDGQHRRAAIEEALKIEPKLGNETISVVFFQDDDLKKSQQIFSDLNRHAVNTTSSIGILYDHRDALSLITKDIVVTIPLLNRYTDKERVSLSKNSTKIIALNHIYNTNLRLIKKTKGDKINEQERDFLFNFWSTLCSSITEWNLIMQKQLTPRDLRTDFIVGHAVFIEAMGLVGSYLFENHPKDWQEHLSNLRNIDWSRANTKDWLGRAFNLNGRIQKNNTTIQLTANRIKQLISLPLNETELVLERKYFEGVV
ncbi:DNA sulfur modification protein DndB [Viridibacillus arvi]|uniref:DNA sulfur modification protein DndB n=1 Tax=Viridibacillus arvi TaxID=263475 RepID=UPI0034CDD624